MSETTDLVVIEKANALTVFKSSDQIEEILAKVEREVMSFVPDVSTAKGRKEIASLAYRVAQTKTYLDSLGKDLVAELKEIPKLIDGNRKTVRDRLDALKEKARQPLSDYEAEQERIKAEQQMLDWHTEALADNEAFDKAARESFESDHEIALLLNDKFDRDAAEAKAEAERQRIAREQEVARQAVEQARREAEAQALREREAAAQREAQLIAQAEREKADRIAAQERAEREAKEAQERTERLAKEAREQAEREKQQAIESAQRKAQEEADRIKRETEQKEAARLAEEKRVADEAAKRAANEAHRKAVGTDVVKGLVEHAGLTREQAIATLKALMSNSIPHTSINY